MAWWDDVGNAVASAVSAVGDAVETVVDTATDAAGAVTEGVADAAEDIINYATGAASNAIGGGIIGSIISGIGGAIIGVVKGVAVIIVDYLNLLRDQGAIIGSLLRLDFAHVIDEVTNLIIDGVGMLVDVFRFVTGGTIVGGFIDSYVRDDLRQFVLSLVTTAFTGQRRTDIISRLGLTHGAWGLPFNATHRVFVMDSNTIDLRAMHNDDHTIDLFALAGVLSFNSFQAFRPRTFVKVMNRAGQALPFPANRYNISKFLEGDNNIRLQVFALKSRAFTQNMRIAARAFKRMGVNITWRELTPISLYASENPHFLPSADQFQLDIGNLNNDDTLDVFFNTSGLKPAGEDENPVIAAAAFHYALDSKNHEGFGKTCGRNITEGGGPCATPARTDACCSVVRRFASDRTPLGSGVVYRDQYPFYVFKHVLTHEMGHYFGLCHITHDGFQDIMFTVATQAVLSPALLRFYYQQQPTFTNIDGQNCWRFIVNQIPQVL